MAYQCRHADRLQRLPDVDFEVQAQQAHVRHSYRLTGAYEPFGSLTSDRRRQLVHRLVIDFEEGSLKKFATVDYQLDATEISRWDSCGGGGSIEVHAVHPDPLTLAPDAGRTSGNFTVALPPSDQLCAPQHVEYTDMTVTNVTTGHVYRLDSISRDYP